MLVSRVCRDKSVIPTLNLASAYWWLQSIDNSSRKTRGGEKEMERGKKVWLVSISFLLHTSAHTHRDIKYAELGLARGHFSYISIKHYIIFLQFEAYDWCACHLFGLHCQPFKKYHLNTKAPSTVWKRNENRFQIQTDICIFICCHIKCGQTQGSEHTAILRKDQHFI